MFANLPGFFEGEARMTELEVLDRNTQGLKELLRVAWRDLANPALTPFERREARNQINQYGAELRRHLQLIEAERNRARTEVDRRRGARCRQAELPHPRIATIDIGDDGLDTNSLAGVWPDYRRALRFCARFNPTSEVTLIG